MKVLKFIKYNIGNTIYTNKYQEIGKLSKTLEKIKNRT